MRFSAAAAALLATATFLAPGAAAADRQSEIEREKAALRQKIREADRAAAALAAEIAEADRRRAALEGRIDELSAELADAELRLAEAEAALGAAEVDVLVAQQSVNLTLTRLSEMQASFEGRVRDVYKSGRAAYVELLLGATSIKELVFRLSFVSKVFQEDGTRLQRLEKLRALLDQERVDAENRKVEAAIQREVIAADREHVAELRRQLVGNRSAVVSEIVKQRRLLQRVYSDKASYLAAMRRLEAESRSIAALLRKRQAGQVYRSTGRALAWPTTGEVTSVYGYRTHPIHGDRRFHAGIDIGAPAGQKVVAAEAGTVVYAGVRSGYGLTVIIDHGNALATLSAHLSSAFVNEGRSVARGATIGAVGCSGYCTGPHLHFETRINGEPRDPMQFF